MSFFIDTWKIMDGPMGMGMGITTMDRGTIWQDPL
jgi:hypothetical protein